MISLVSHSAKETSQLGKRLSKKLKGGEAIALVGDLGAGKTVITRGIAAGLGIKHRIVSPTFVLMRIYPVRGWKIIRRLVHVDAYRVRNAADLLDIGLGDYLAKPDTITVIEWADRVKKILPRRTIRITLRHGTTINRRGITVTNLRP